jgi:hypothetical protein
MSDKKPLSREAIEKAEDRSREWVEIPEWGGGAYIQEWDDVTRDAWEEFVASTREGGTQTAGMRRRAVLLSLVNAEGEPVFDQESGDKILRKKSAKVIDRLFDVIDAKNLLTPKARAQEKKASSQTPGGSTSSG